MAPPPIQPSPVARTGDDRPAANLFAYVWRMSGWRQTGLFVLAGGVVLLQLAPIELQRRIIDHAITPGDLELLVRLVLVYAVVLITQQTLKFALQVSQGWLAESAIIYTRRHLVGLYARGEAGDRDNSGEAVSIIGGEVDKLGGFVGQGPSSAFMDASMLLGVLAYMLWVEPVAALIALGLIVPQLALTPLMQRKINQLIEEQLRLNRDLGRHVSQSGPLDAESFEGPLCAIYTNRLWLHIYKQLMKATLNLLNAGAPLMMLGIGGAMVVAGETTVGVLVAFLSGFQRIADPIRNLIGFYRQCAQAGVQHDMIAKWM